MTLIELRDLMLEKGIAGIDVSKLIIKKDGFIYLEPCDIAGVDGYNLIVARTGERYSTELKTSVARVIANRDKPIISMIDGNFEEMKSAARRTGAEIVDNVCIWGMRSV